MHRNFLKHQKKFLEDLIYEKSRIIVNNVFWKTYLEEASRKMIHKSL